MAKAKRTAPRKVARKVARKATRKPRGPAGVDANLLADLMKWAKASGADAADALYVNGESVSVAQRLGKREKLESSEGHEICPWSHRRIGFQPVRHKLVILNRQVQAFSKPRRGGSH